MLPQRRPVRDIARDELRRRVLVVADSAAAWTATYLATMRSLPLSELRVGDSAALAKTITEADVMQFAAISGDFNPLHVDAEFAARSGFGARVAHGTLAIGVAAGILGTLLPGLGTVALRLHVEFVAPVLVADTVTAHAEVAALDSDRGLVSIALRWTNQREELVASGEALVRPPAAPVPA
jgi:3-hydroxybutyryl-CoA dehydratase